MPVSGLQCQIIANTLFLSLAIWAVSSPHVIMPWLEHGIGVRLMELLKNLLMIQLWKNQLQITSWQPTLKLLLQIQLTRPSIILSNSWHTSDVSGHCKYSTSILYVCSLRFVSLVTTCGIKSSSVSALIDAILPHYIPVHCVKLWSEAENCSKSTSIENAVIL